MSITEKRLIGNTGEQAVEKWLALNNFKILARNYCIRYGEVDLIAQHDEVIAFIEVKTRKSGELGYPEEAVGTKKQMKMSQLALWYLQKKNKTDAQARFDVVAVTMSASCNEIKLIKNAFDFIDA